MDPSNANGNELLREILAWHVFQNRRAYAETLAAALLDPKHFEAFELSDGTRTQSDIAKAVGVSQPTMSGLWTRWRRLGIVTVEGGKARHLVAPSELGMRPGDSERQRGSGSGEPSANDA
jgi:hypothetical protein